jgi:hypothetical protein
MLYAVDAARASLSFVRDNSKESCCLVAVIHVLTKFEKGRMLMTIDKKDLFERTQALWPKVLEPDASLKRSSLAQVLNKLYHEIEASVEEDDHWLQIAVWSYYQALSTEFDRELTEFSLHRVDFDDFDRMMLENLKGDKCWDEEREIYLSS